VLYWMMRLFLSERMAGTFFDTPGRPQRSTREGYPRSVFSNNFIFIHRKRTYVYTPFPSLGDHLLGGAIVRQHTILIRKAPEAKSEDVPDWESANVFIDTSGDGDGQKVAIQDVAAVGAPLPVFRSATDYINSSNPGSDWYIAVNTITSAIGFWEAVENNRGKITELDLTFAAPNTWKGVTGLWERAATATDRQQRGR